MINKRLMYTVLFFVLLIILFIVSRPKFLFDQDGNLIPFGTGEGKTIIPLGIIVIILAFVSFYMFTMIDLVFEKK